MDKNTFSHTASRISEAAVDWQGLKTFGKKNSCETVNHKFSLVCSVRTCMELHLCQILSGNGEIVKDFSQTQKFYFCSFHCKEKKIIYPIN